MAKFNVVNDDQTIEDASIEMEALRGMADHAVAKKDITSEDEFIEFSKDADAILHGSGLLISGRMMDALPRLKVISCASVGFDNVDIEAATERGIMVTNAPDYGSNEVAEHATAMILALERQLFMFDREIRTGGWGHALFKIYSLHSPSTRVVGLVAFGRIARRVAKRVQACGFKVIAYDPYVPRWDFEFSNVERVPTLLELMRRSDFISVHVPHNKETTHLIGAKEIAAMKPTAYFVNTGRGKTMDEKALYKALKEKKIAGAALDVFENEPLDPNNPILKLDNVIVTPHVAGFTLESSDRRRGIAAEMVADALSGRRPLSLINQEVYGKARANKKRSGR